MSEIEQLACPRSMWETLMAAATTLALFVSANWGRYDLLVDTTAKLAIGSILWPFLALGQSVVNASRVSQVKNSLDVKMDTLHGTIDIITAIPIYIRFPASALTSDDLNNLKGFRGYESISDLQNVCPLELRPAAAMNLHAPPINTDARVDVDIHNTNYAASCTALASKVDQPPPTLDQIDRYCTFMLDQLPPGRAGPKSTAADVASINTNAATTPLVDEELDVTDQVMLLRLPSAYTNLEERVVLLHLGLVPTYKDLSFLRSRNKFQTVITGLQAGGYMLTVIQRALQNLGISPVEAFVSFLCITICLQLLIELYACGHYQRPLLLPLNDHQIRSLVRDAGDITVNGCSYFPIPLIKIVSFSLILGLSMYYFVHYLHAYLICSLSALLFFLGHVLLFMHFSCMLCCSNFFGLLYVLMYASSIILAVVSTFIDWKAFQQQANQKAWYAWILPHVSS